MGSDIGALNVIELKLVARREVSRQCLHERLYGKQVIDIEYTDAEYGTTTEQKTLPKSGVDVESRGEEKPWCEDCRSVGMWHCSDPIHCGGMQYPEPEEL